MLGLEGRICVPYIGHKGSLYDHVALPKYFNGLKTESYATDSNSYLPSSVLILSLFSEVLSWLRNLESLHPEFEVFPECTVAKNH